MEGLQNMEQMRRIVIDISPTINRYQFDVTVTANGEVETEEKVSRDVVHRTVREAINAAIESFE